MSLVFPILSIFDPFVYATVNVNPLIVVVTLPLLALYPLPAGI